MSYAETLLENFRGRENVTLTEAKARCGFSDHEAFAALESLRRMQLASGRWEWGGTVAFQPRDEGVRE